MSEIKTMVEVKLLADSKIVKETLSRMGIANKKKNILYPSCYLYQNFESYYVVHFKEMFLLTRANGYNNISNKDIERKNSIIFCLENWGLVEVLDKKTIEPHDEFVYVLPFKDKHKWNIQHKFNVSSTEVVS